MTGRTCEFLMLAGFGLEIVECAGVLVKALAAGDEVHAAVLLCRDTSRPQIAAAAKVIGIEQVTLSRRRGW